MSDFIRHSIHCHGYRGCDVGFDDDACTCGATLKYCQEEIERLQRLLDEVDATVATTLFDLGLTGVAMRFRESKSPLHQRLSMVLWMIAPR